MSVSSWIRRQFKTGVSTTDTVPLGFTAGATSFVAADGTTFPDGSVGPFQITVDQGLATEEPILIQSRSGATFTVASGGRGYNGGTAYAHGAGATIFHTLGQQDMDEANQVAVATLGQISAAGDLLVGSGSHALGKLAVGAANTFLTSNGTTLAYVAFVANGVAHTTSGNVDGVSNSPARSDHSHAGVYTLNGVTGVVTLANGYGITGNTTATPTPAVSLTTDANHLSSDYTVTNAFAQFLGTHTLGAGTWHVHCVATVDMGKTALEAVDIEVVVGTATATFEGATSATGSVAVTSSNNDVFQTLTIDFIATVTVAGTLSFQAKSVLGSGATIKQLSGGFGVGQATGYTAVRVA